MITTLNAITQAVGRYWTDDALHSRQDIIDWLHRDFPTMRDDTLTRYIYQGTVNQNARAAPFVRNADRVRETHETLDFRPSPKYDIFFRYKNRYREECPPNLEISIPREEPCLEKYDATIHGDWKIIIKWNPSQNGIESFVERISQPFVENNVFRDGVSSTYPNEISRRYEGHGKKVLVNKYERDSNNRKDCLAFWGFCCYVCGFDFYDNYRELGKDFIHVHHLVPLSRLGGAYAIDPAHDLIPVCPNCHAMLHRSPADERAAAIRKRLKKQIEKNKSRKVEGKRIISWRCPPED